METFKLFSLVWSKSNVGYVKKCENVDGVIDDYSSVVKLSNKDDMFKIDTVIIRNNNGYYLTKSLLSDAEVYSLISKEMVNVFNKTILEAQNCIDSLSKL